VLTNAEQVGAMESILFHIVRHYLGSATSDWTAAFKARDEEEQKTRGDTESEWRAAESLHDSAPPAIRYGSPRRLSAPPRHEP